MMDKILSPIILLVVISFCIAQDGPKVTTKTGKIQGYYLTSNEGKKYEAYEGIPYAMPPIGERRFEPPEPIEPWNKELLANKTSEVCLQHRRTPGKTGSYVFGTEDCLYLDVYAPIRKNKSTPLPVIFWIHGGAFQYGGSTKFGAKYLIDHDVIFVAIKYRVGVLGFLSTEDDILPGNMGLKDQNAALRWVNENIEFFGGDPKRVTLAGLSAGGVSVHYHYLSPMSAGLFHAGMSFSGTAFDCWAQTENSREKAFKVADLAGCPTNDLKNMIICMKLLRAEALVRTEKEFMPWQLHPFTPFGPVAERFSKNPFINRSPIEIINSGDVQDIPWVTGVTSEEGIYPVAEFSNNTAVLKDLDSNWETIAPNFLDYQYTIPDYMHSRIARKIRYHYFGNQTINRTSIMTMIHLAGDRFFLVDAEKAAKAQSRVNKSPVWFFYYTYRANESLSGYFSNDTSNLGVGHGDDISLVLDNPLIIPKTKSDIEMNKHLVNLWVSVAYNGKPEFGPAWLPVNSTTDDLVFLEISGPGKFQVRNETNFAQRQFWSTIDFDENRGMMKPASLLFVPVPQPSNEKNHTCPNITPPQINCPKHDQENTTCQNVNCDQCKNSADGYSSILKSSYIALVVACFIWNHVISDYL